MTRPRLFKTLLALAVVVAICGVLRQQWPALARTVAHVDPAWLGIALLISLAYRVANACGWPLVLRALHCGVPMLRGVRIWLVSETMRWLPGGVWGMSSRVFAAGQLGVPAATATMSLAVELLLTVAAWTLTAAAGLGVSGVVASCFARISAPRLALAAAAGLILVAAVVFVARRFPDNRYARKARGFLTDLRGVLAGGPRLPLLCAVLALYLVLCVVNALAFFAVIRAFTPDVPSLATVAGINAAGWLVGFFAVCAPGGLGVREGGMTVLLAALLPLEVAVGSVVVWRLVQIAAEAAALAVFLLPDWLRNARLWPGHGHAALKYEQP